MFDKRSGFALIEILITIAIIGIISTVILAATNPSRKKAKDARIISDLRQLQIIIETDANSTIPRSYSGFAASTNPLFIKMKDDIERNGGQLTPREFAGGVGYLIFSPLNTAGWFCIDSVGNSLFISSIDNLNGNALVHTCKGDTWDWATYNDPCINGGCDPIGPD